jgi:hypothetical protein
MSRAACAATRRKNIRAMFPRLKGVLPNSRTPVQSVIPTSARSARGGICKKIN